MPEANSYLLEFLIDETQTSLDDLKKKVAKAFNRHALSVEWKPQETTSGHVKLTIRGSLEDVDTCHQRLNGEFSGVFSCIRLRDEAGDEIRQQAYSILAHIEQRLRTFINQAMIEVRGFDWWDSTVPFLTEQGIRDGVQKVEERIAKPSLRTHHPLELTYFEHLIRLLTESMQYWSADKALCASGLLELLADCSSIEELRTTLEEKTREISLWDEVFARYIDDVDKWKELAKTLTEFVIPVRNQVMHHRPMHDWQLRRLQATAEVVDSLLSAAVAELSEAERAEARQVSGEWFNAWARALGELSFAALAEVGSVVKPLMKQQEEISQTWNRILEEALARFSLPAIGGLFEPFVRQREELSRTLIETVRTHQEQLTHTSRDMPNRPRPGMTYVGSKHSATFHRPSCRHISRILPENQIRFRSRDEAVGKGYVPCARCEPR
jgi:hypothetical protein